MKRVIGLLLSAMLVFSAGSGSLADSGIKNIAQDFVIRNNIHFTDTMEEIENNETMNELDGSQSDILYYGRDKLIEIDNSEIDYFFGDDSRLQGVLYHLNSFVPDRKTNDGNFRRALKHFSSMSGLEEADGTDGELSDKWMATNNARSVIEMYTANGGTGEITESACWTLTDALGNRILFDLVKYQTAAENSREYYYCEAGLFYLEAGE